MNAELIVYTALALGVSHTLLGPDHYLPLASVAAARGWRPSRLMAVTLLFAAGHLSVSLLLVAGGAALHTEAEQLLQLDELRAGAAAWLLIAAGVCYGCWSLRQLLRGDAHSHSHRHGELEHSHAHRHGGTHSHLHGATAQRLLPWLLFVTLLLGPCELLVVLMLYPLSVGDYATAYAAATAFSAATLLAMLVVVPLATFGFSRCLPPRAAAWGHPLTAGVLLLSGGFALAAGAGQ